MTAAFGIIRARKIKLGRKGERLAGKLLEMQGYQLLVRNWKHPAGEIDLICRDGNNLVFVEVKTRHYRNDLDLYSNLSNRQKRRIKRSGTAYLKKLNCPELGGRFDLIEIVFNRWGFLKAVFHRSNILNPLFPGNH